MAYKEYIYRFPQSNEVEIKYMGKYGAKGEKRAKRNKASPETIRRQNRTNKAIKVRRLLKANFTEDDYWVTLKYPAGARLCIDQVKKDLKNFNDRMRYQYEKYGEQYKWVRRIEIGKRGGVHIHMVINRIREGPPTDKLIREKWKPHKVNYTQLYKDEDYDKLAEYLVKDYETDTQLSMFDAEDQKVLTNYSSSRNLIRPEPETKIYTRRTVRKIIDEGPKPTAGYYIDKNSVRMGVNPYSGLSYIKYTEIRAGTRSAPHWKEWGIAT